MYKYSVIIPVFNRPAEVDELLSSLVKQTQQDFEVLVVEDGSTVTCGEVVERYQASLPLRYYCKENSGPGQSRNYGSARASGQYFIYFDSDCIIPERYFEIVDQQLATGHLDAFGGPDQAHISFTPMQKAINYAMTSFFTTGGIRGGERKMDKFYPRSFNMGLTREVFESTRGFADMRFGEDIDLSARIVKAGFKTGLIRDAWVYHKRRTNLKQFFKQVHNSGIARIHLFKRHPEQLKVVHMLPAVFTMGVALLLVCALYSLCFLAPLLLFCVSIFMDSLFRSRQMHVALLAVMAGFVQLTGYGTGFLRAFWSRIVLGRGEFNAFKKNFYQ